MPIYSWIVIFWNLLSQSIEIYVLALYTPFAVTAVVSVEVLVSSAIFHIRFLLLCWLSTKPHLFCLEILVVWRRCIYNLRRLFVRKQRTTLVWICSRHAKSIFRSDKTYAILFFSRERDIKIIIENYLFTYIQQIILIP